MSGRLGASRSAAAEERVPPAPAGSRVRLLICEDSDELRALLRAAAARIPELEIVGEAGRVAELVALAARCRPDVILLDLVASEHEADALVQASARHGRVVVFSGRRLERLGPAARARVSAYVDKLTPIDAVMRAVLRAAAGTGAALGARA